MTSITRRGRERVVTARSYWWVPGSVVLVVLGLVLLLGPVLGLGQGSEEPKYSLEQLDPVIVHNYEYVAAHADHAARIPCYCGCESLDHRSLLDCFVRPEGGWEPHATYCRICGQEADDLEAQLSQGASIESVRASIDAAYGRLGPPTRTR